MASHNPPQPRALSDSELNEQVLKLQSEPDGLVKAMELIESQAKLREEDAKALANWKLETQLEVASTEPSRDEFFPDLFSPGSPIESKVPDPGIDSWKSETTEVFSGPAFEAEIEGNPSEPEIDIFADVPPPTYAAYQKPEDFPPQPESGFAIDSSSEAAPAESSSTDEEDFESILFASADPSGINQEPTIQTFKSAAGEPNDSTYPDAEQVSAPKDDVPEIVASLNASYAALATSSEEGLEVTAFVEESVTVVTSEQVPEPVGVTAQAPEIADREEPMGQQKTKSMRSLVWSTLSLATTPMVLLFAALLHQAGTSFGQGVIVLVSVMLTSSVIFSIAAIAGKRASSSIAVVSRAAFGVWGNSLPATLLLLMKLFWLAALLAIATRIITPLIFNQPWFSTLAAQFIFPAEFLATAIVLAAVALVAALIAGWGGITIYRSQQITTLISAIGLGVITYFVVRSVSISGITAGEAMPSQQLIDLSIFAFVLFGLPLFTQASDFARKLTPETPGSKVFFLSFISSFFVPTAVGVIGLVWFFAGDEMLSGIFLGETLAAVAASAPIWIFVIVTVALGISLLQLIASGFYSISGGVAALGIRMPSWATQLVLGILVVSGTIAVSYLIPISSLLSLTSEMFLLVGVVAAAWSGIIISDTLLRRHGYHEVSLTRDYGFYGRVNWPNLVGLLVSVGMGFGYLAPQGPLSSWSGYLGVFTPEIYSFTGSSIGIAMAFGLSLLIPIFFGIPKIREQERGLLELESRRAELKEFLDTVE